MEDYHLLACLRVCYPQVYFRCLAFHPAMGLALVLVVEVVLAAELVSAAEWALVVAELASAVSAEVAAEADSDVVVAGVWVAAAGEGDPAVKVKNFLIYRCCRSWNSAGMDRTVKKRVCQR
jgi:hypothetical protein